MGLTHGTGSFTDVRTHLVEDFYKTYEDTSFVSGDSPIVFDVETDLERSGEECYIINDGSGSFTVALLLNEKDVYGDEATLKNGDVLTIRAIRIRKIRITWVANSAYRVFVA